MARERLKPSGASNFSRAFTTANSLTDGFRHREAGTMKKGVMTFALIALAAIAASPAAADREWRGGYGHGPGTVADIAGIPGLNLSAEQTERIEALREAHRKDIRPLQEQLMGKSRRLRELWLARTPDRERILALQHDVHDLRGRLLEKLAVYRLDVLRMLTPDQQVKAKIFEAERHRGRMGAGMNRGPFPGWHGGPTTGESARERRPGLPQKPGAEAMHGAAEPLPANR
jgi:Spy/CpxP family protein refolding chaperone